MCPATVCPQKILRRVPIKEVSLAIDTLSGSFLLQSQDLAILKYKIPRDLADPKEGQEQ